MPGLIKLVIFALAAYAVWYVYSLAKRLRAAERALGRQGREPMRQAASVAQDLVPCRVCGAYVAASGAAPCERADCPHRR